MGDYSQGEAFLEQMVEAMRPNPGSSSYLAVVIPMVAYITGMASHLEIARTAAQVVLSSASPFPLIKLWTRTGLGMMAVVQEDAVAAQEQYEVLRSVRVAEWYGIMATDRLLGLLSQTMGNLDLAAIHFDDAMAFCRKAGYRPELAWTCHDYADALLQRGGPGDLDQAMSLIDDSLACGTHQNGQFLRHIATSPKTMAYRKPGLAWS